MLKRIAQASPHAVARIAGVLYLADILTSVLGDSLAGSAHVVPGDAAATASGILAHQAMVRLGVAANLVATACYVAVTVLFYALFKVVKQSVALLATVASLTALAIWTSGSLSQLAATLIVPGRGASGPRADQQVLELLEWNARASAIGNAVFATYCVLIGYLIVKSAFLPRVLGILMVIGGIGLLTYLSRTLAHALYPYNAVPALAGEISLMLWLLLRGANHQTKAEAGQRITATSVSRP